MDLEAREEHEGKPLLGSDLAGIERSLKALEHPLVL